MGRQDSEAMAAFLADADSHRTRFAQESSGRPGVPWPYVLLEWQTADLPPTVRRVLVTTAANIAGLRRIVDRCGWPGRSLVGEDGADAAWLVLQHGASGIRTVGTPESVAFVRRCLPLLRRAVTTGEAHPRHLAAATDAVCRLDGTPPEFGVLAMDFAVVGDVASLRGAPDRTALDTRRTAIGLPPVAVDARRRSRRETLSPAGPDRAEPWPISTFRP